MDETQRIPIEPPGSVIFDPFQDRTSRDIRNSLSSALAQAIAGGNYTAVEDMAASLLIGHSGQQQPYRSYIESRLVRYRRALAAITEGSADPLWQGLILWDLQLFFEMHEVLEHAWYHAEGNRKLLLQAMIRAAGVYVKLEFGYNRQAAKMAAKAVDFLALNADMLRQYFEPEKLLDALKTLEPKPPSLLGDTDTV